MKKNISAFLILNKSQEMAGVESMIIVEEKQAPVKTVDREKVIICKNSYQFIIIMVFAYF